MGLRDPCEGAYHEGMSPAEPSEAVQTATKTRPKVEEKPKTDQPWLWNVVLLDDDDHSYEYVIKMMQELFGHPLEKAFQIAITVDADGRAVCLTTHKEHAELKRDQIHASGPDKLIASSVGAMRSIIEPAECGGDDDDD